MNVATELESPQGKGAATGHMKALVYHGPGQRVWEEAAPGYPARHGRHRPDHPLDHLRYRPAHPEGRRAECDTGAHSRARGRRRRDRGG